LGVGRFAALERVRLEMFYGFVEMVLCCALGFFLSAFGLALAMNLSIT
jgi:hypothetical protein